jgi:hypothetical protein
MAWLSPAWPSPDVSALTRELLPVIAMAAAPATTARANRMIAPARFGDCIATSRSRLRNLAGSGAALLKTVVE